MSYDVVLLFKSQESNYPYIISTLANPVNRGCITTRWHVHFRTNCCSKHFVLLSNTHKI